VHLVLATPAEKRARDLVTYSAWGDPLDMPAWLAREAALRAHPWCTNGMETWLWKSDAGEVLASCETFRSPSLLRGEPGTAHAVASVYTEPHLRGHGHATRMMTALVAALPAHDPKAHATTLFSDVGAPIYERSGYRAVAAIDRVLPSEGGDPSDGVDELIGESALAQHVPAPGRGELVIAPPAEQLDWHLERERLYARLIGRRRPCAIGARRGSARALWAGNLRSSYLAVLFVEGEDERDIFEVLRAAQRVAHDAGLGEVRVWEDDVMRDVAPSVGARVERSGGLPMIAPLVEGADASAWSRVTRALWV
jgi:GNAT superfamily N-acetyltransferase